MKVYLIVGSREGVPYEVLNFAWDDESVGFHRDEFNAEVKLLRLQAKREGFTTTRLIGIRIDEQDLIELLTEVPEIDGEAEGG